MTQMTQNIAKPLLRLAFRLGHRAKNNDPAMTQMTQKFNILTARKIIFTGT